MRRGTQFLGFGHHVPKRLVLNAEIEAQLGLSEGWIESRTGIRSRYWAEPGDTLSGLATEAGAMALDNAGIGHSEIGLLLLATSTPDHLLPPSAPLVAAKLGLSSAGAVDLAGACAGFIYALLFAEGFVRLQGKAALVIAANILSRRINPEERASSVLFADAAGAVVIGPSADPDLGVAGVSLDSDGAHYGLISIAAGGSSKPFQAGLNADETLMTISDGREVFVRAVDMMSDCSRRAMRAAATVPEKISRFVPHQANSRIIDAVARNLRIQRSVTANTLVTYGNSSAATIPLSLSLAHGSNPLRPGEILLLAAAGAGLTGGALVFNC